MTEELTLKTFAKETGFRFRVTKFQAARIALTKLDNTARQALTGLDVDKIADTLQSRNAKGEPFNWVEEVPKLISEWSESFELDRQGAFAEFIASGGLERLQGRPDDIPDSVYLETDLTLDNFSSKVEAAIGTPRRFRVSREQFDRITAKELTRTEALAEVVAVKRTAASVPNVFEEEVTV